MVLRPFTAPGARLALKSKRAGALHHGARGESEVILDLSRLLSRSFHAAPTGIDRVEYVYARELLDRIPDRLAFAAVHPAGGYYGRLSNHAVRQFLAFTAAKWRNAGLSDASEGKAATIRHMFATRPRPVPRANGSRIYLQVSPHHLDDQSKVGAILRAEGAKFVTLVHDVIPLSHPEFARPQGAAEHLRRVRTIDRYATGIIGNSQATVDALAPHMKRGLDGRIIRVAHFGADAPDIFGASDEGVPDRPYFVYISTIEPRKNHLLLLNVWRRLVETLGDAAPVLVLIGRRGWENENVIDLLERGEALRGHVIEAGEVSDNRMQSLVARARAMLMPSFAEGFGMPVVEALSAGVPVICSDILAHREVGGEAPDYIDPLDGLGWMRAIGAYARDGSPERAAQQRRIAAWRPPTWRDYFDIVTDLIEEVTASVP
ncbi:glycosyltransferase involved in cell wall biosynthesis [Sphingobium sp. OAS761]|uniref:glycosyltransferase family 4 protein n=1 Tax=Sphingobium sp. OAS761 TaxID=2817901 RepID=UPI0020A22D35|nr:glycosyltransferase family 1 protein [Sphingobium sp. OAS761]MCP1468491.1 glycosyltransferase involved in cell wall biosynthesis [Sphingobium sp. OAS761]